MLTLTALLITTMLHVILPQAQFPEFGKAYQLDFANELSGKVVFLSDSEMVYGDIDKRGTLQRIDIVKASEHVYLVVWDEGPEKAVRIEHQYDLANHQIRSHTRVSDKQFILEGDFKIVE